MRCLTETSDPRWPYIGGKNTNRQHRKRSGIHSDSGGKTPLIGAVSRKGNVVARVLRHSEKAMLAHDSSPIRR
jgi:hypothetical protein